MAIDAYSPCPGGTGKKIKFCCNDLLPELQKIDRMVEGEQYLACLQRIDLLLAQDRGKDRACLLATKCMLLRATKQLEAAKTTIETFLEKHPDNQIALSESAILAAETDPRAALNLVQRAMQASDGALAGRTYQAMGLVAGTLLHRGFPLPARALLELQAEITEKDSRPHELLSALCQAGDIPLLLREDAPLASCPKDVPWRDQFTEAGNAFARGDWQKAAELYAALTAEAPDSPALWRNLASLRGWLADNVGCAEALRTYAALRSREENGLDDAVEAEATAMFLSEDPLGDQMEMLKMVWGVKDADRAQEAFLSSPRILAVPFDPARFSDGETPPPKGAYLLLDRPMPESAEGLDAEAIPLMLGQARQFGRQTDREAHLEVMGVVADDLTAVHQLVREAAGEAVESEPSQEVIGHWSASRKLLQPAWQPPRDAKPELIRPMLEQYLTSAILDQWPDLKLGIFDGRSPREVAGDESCRVRLSAALLVLEHWAESLPGNVDFNELRSRLQLPVLEPIDLQERSAVEVPIVRLARLEIEKLSDEQLLTAYYRAAAYAIRPVSRTFAKAIIDRPSLADSDERLHAFSTLARTEEDIDRALDYIDQGRRATEAKKESGATWDLMELSLQFARHDGKEAMRRIEHIPRDHLEEPGVGEALTRMLIDVGLIRPDGTPAFGPEMAGAAGMPEAAEPEPGGLWTPDSAEPDGGGGGGKLRTPE